MMRHAGTPDAILAALETKQTRRAFEQARALVPWSKNEIDAHEAAALFRLATGCDRGDAFMLEIGTAWGYSAAILAQAAPHGTLTTLTPSEKHWRIAEGRLRWFPNVRCLRLSSWEYLSIYRGPLLDFVFVDGYHGMVVRDLPWWDWLKSGGVMVFHDYTPADGHRGCEPVYRTLTAARDAFRPFDVEVVTDERQGFVGWVKREGEKLPALGEAGYSWRFSDDGHAWVPGVPV